MFNRYVPGGFDLPSREVPPAPEEIPAETFSDVTEDAPAETPASPTAEEAKKGLLSNIKSLFGGSIKLPDMNADTVLLLVLVYFLVADDKENISDTLLIIGVLLLLGF